MVFPLSLYFIAEFMDRCSCCSEVVCPFLNVAKLGNEKTPDPIPAYCRHLPGQISHHPCAQGIGESCSPLRRVRPIKACSGDQDLEGI